MIELLTGYLHGGNLYFQLFRFFIVLFTGVLLTKTVLMPLTSKLYLRKGDPKAQHSMENIVAIVGLFVAFTLALQAGNFGDLVTVLAAIAAAATVAVGFGMRDQVSSVVAGIFIHADNPFVKGDYIKVGETEGEIKNISLRATVLNGQNQLKTVIPNAKLTTEVVENYTKGNRTKSVVELETPLKNLEKAEKKAKKLVSSQERVDKRSEPETYVTGLEDGKAALRIEYWVKKPADVKTVKDQLYRELKPLMAEKSD